MTKNKYRTSLDGLVIENPVESFLIIALRERTSELSVKVVKLFPGLKIKFFKKGDF